MRLLSLLIILTTTLTTPTLAAEEKRCFYINSYHAGYAWSDAIEAAIQAELSEHCTVTTFHMDTKRNTTPAFGRKKALEAKERIESLQPDIIIASDDNASKYLIAPYYKNVNIPVVFCGINWTAKAYAYPYHNATGMIEVSAIKELLHTSREVIGPIKKVAFLAAKGIRTDEKEFEWMRKTYAREGVSVTPFYAASMREWEQAYLSAQTFDFIVLNNIAGIKAWDKQRAIQFTRQHAKKLTVTTYDFMAIYSILSMTKVAEEQGLWAANVAIRILQGRSPSSIPVVANRRFNMFVNPAILSHTDIQLSESILFKAIKVEP